MPCRKILKGMCVCVQVHEHRVSLFLEMVLLKERDLSGCCLNSMGLGKGKQSPANTEVARLWHAWVPKESG